MQTLLDDVKTKLRIDDDLVASPKEALSRALAERVAMRNKNLKRCNFLIQVYDNLDTRGNIMYVLHSWYGLMVRTVF